MYLYTALSKQTTVMSYFDEMHASYVHQNMQLCLNDHPHSKAAESDGRNLSLSFVFQIKLNNLPLKY